MMRIHVSTRVHGFHRWPGAPESRAYLRHRHHHEFKVGVAIDVTNPDRELEFHDVRDRLDRALRGMAPSGDFGDMSCEHIGQAILDDIPEAEMAVVDEDDLHGAVVTREPVEAHQGMRRPEMVTVCGSTRFKDETLAAIFELEKEGKAVLSVGGFMHADQLPTGVVEKAAFDSLHKRKIRMSDSIYVVNVDGYVGHSTSEEIRLAWDLGVPVRWRYPQFALERPSWFYDEMEKKLLARAAKGGWRKDGLLVLLERVEGECKELREAVRLFTEGPATAARLGEIMSEAADVANQSMTVADVARMMWGKGYR